MKKKLSSIILSGILAIGILTGCGQTEDTVVVEEKDGYTVGVVMPNQTSERWINDGANMKLQLEELGYNVDLRYANDDIELQVSQIEDMVANQVDCLVIASIDSTALVEVEKKAQESQIPIIAYDRLLMDTDAVSYYASFDNRQVGHEIGEYIEKNMSLHTATEEGVSYTVELFMGSPDDNNAYYLYNGLMEVLKPYFDSGVLVCKSGKTSFEDTCILRWSQETAKERCAQYLDEFYTDEDLDICLSAFDGFAYGCIEALEEAGYTKSNWPVITGQDAELRATQNIINGKQTMTIYKDTRVLAKKCVTMVQAILEGTTPSINNNYEYHNNVKSVPSYLCKPEAVDKANYKKILIRGGYYTEKQLGE